MTEKKQAEKCAELLQALAEPHRIRIVECLRIGTKNVTQLAKELGTEIVNVSHHLSVMRSAGLVETVKDGRFVLYSLNPKLFQNDGNRATSLDLGWCRLSIPHN